MRIGFGSDHTAVALKLELIRHLEEQGHECIDYGTHDPNVRMDYPVPGKAVAEAVRKGEVEKFFKAQYEGGRHEARIRMLADIEREYGASWEKGAGKA